MDRNKTELNLNKMLRHCRLCPHECRIDRTSKKTGYCQAPHVPVISAAMAHFGEEPPISGNNGSGTIFFSYCNMGCIYCQNYQISQQYQGKEVPIPKLAEAMIKLQHQGCHNINLVSPTIWVPQIVEALSLARNKGLNIPIVYNTGGYDKPEIINMLKGLVDIYMPDMRYSHDDYAYRYSGVKKYVQYNRQSVKEMYDQVKELKVDSQGIAVKGLIIRLLVLPNNIGGLTETINFIKNELSPHIPLSIMSQYHPVYKARNFSQLSRGITASEYNSVVDYAQKLGFKHGYIQDYTGLNTDNDPFLPDFSQKEVFGCSKK